MLLAAPAVFVLVLLVMIGGYWLAIVRPERTEQQALRRRLGRGRTAGLPAASLVKEPERRSAVASFDKALERWDGAFGSVRAMIGQSGLQVTVGAVLLSSIFLGAVAGGLLMWRTRSALLSVAGGICAAALPMLYLRRAAVKRLAVFEEQFPESIELLARALRAGHALTTGLQMVADEAPNPVGGEFRTLFEQQNYGMSLPDALRAFAARVPVLDARFFVTAVLTQRETGGNLSEVLDNLASVIRERFRVKRQVRVMSAHGRITGWVLGALPPALAGILLLVSPTHIRLLVDDPLGLDLMLGAIGLQVIGVLCIRRIVDVEY
jgi:tight adherence protein B